MASRAVEVTPLAWEDINRALVQAEAERPGGGEALLREILQAGWDAARDPTGGRPFTAPGRIPRAYRCLNLASWRIFCRVTEDRLLMVRCLRS